MRPEAFLLFLPLLAQQALAKCKMATGKVLRKNQQGRDEHYIYQCVEEAPGDFYLKSVGCIYDGVVLKKNDPIMDDYYVYECKEGRDGSMGVQTIACVDPKGNAVPKGGLIRRDSYVLKCSADRYGSLRAAPYGCVAKSNAVALIGQVFTGDRFWYTCRLRNGQPFKELGGCVSDEGKKVAPKGWYLSDGFTVTCHCRKSLGRCSARVSGCAEDTADGKGKRRFLGETWLQGTAPFRYKVTCKTCSLGITIVRSNTRCRYLDDRFMEAGCMVRRGGKLFACGINWANGLQLYERRDSRANRSKFAKEKYRFC